MERSSFFVERELDIDWLAPGLKEVRVGEFASLILWIHVFAIEALREVGGENLEICFCKGLAQTDSLPSIERQEAGRVSLFAVGGET